MQFALRITKQQWRHTQCLILIAFPRQQASRERASVLRYTYIASPVTAWIYITWEEREQIQNRLWQNMMYRI